MYMYVYDVYKGICMYMHVYACIWTYMHVYKACPSQCMYMYVYVCIRMYTMYLHVFCMYMHVFPEIAPSDTGTDATTPKHSL